MSTPTSKGELRGDDILPFWLTNDGIETKKLTLTFVELAELVRDMGRIADDCQDPLGLVEKVQAMTST